jgi:hypothetical protein
MHRQFTFVSEFDRSEAGRLAQKPAQTRGRCAKDKRYQQDAQNVS